MKERILILSGPSGSGKSTLCKILQDSIKDIYFSISTTTRASREGEIDGKHYHFCSQEQFINDVKAGLFLEWAQVHNHYYGTALAPIQNALKEGRLVIFDVDVQGHTSIKDAYPHAKSIFITTKNKEVLRQRLLSRQTDSSENVELRLLHAYNEMKHIGDFDYLIVNDDLESSKRAILSIAYALEYTLDKENSCEGLWQGWNLN